MHTACHAFPVLKGAAASCLTEGLHYLAAQHVLVLLTVCCLWSPCWGCCIIRNPMGWSLLLIALHVPPACMSDVHGDAGVDWQMFNLAQKQRRRDMLHVYGNKKRLVPSRGFFLTEPQRKEVLAIFLVQVSTPALTSYCHVHTCYCIPAPAHKVRKVLLAITTSQGGDGGNTNIEFYHVAYRQKLANTEFLVLLSAYSARICMHCFCHTCIRLGVRMMIQVRQRC